jgi:hypothetical protein
MPKQHFGSQATGFIAHHLDALVFTTMRFFFLPINVP